MFVIISCLHNGKLQVGQVGIYTSKAQNESTYHYYTVDTESLWSEKISLPTPSYHFLRPRVMEYLVRFMVRKGSSHIMRPYLRCNLVITKEAIPSNCCGIHE